MIPASDPFDEQTRQRAKEIIARYGRPRSALLPLLHLVQSVEGHVSLDGIAFCADQLELTTAEVTAVVTFYSMYKQRPCGQHLVSVCTNTLCAVLGGDEVYDTLKAHLGVAHQGTAGAPGEAGSVTLEHAECLAACDFAPVLQVNYEYYDNQTPESAVELVDALRRGERPAPSRGAALTDWRTVEMELAGYPDRLDDEVHGPSASPETLVGLELADSRGWRAPDLPDGPPPLPAPPPPPEKS